MIRLLKILAGLCLVIAGICLTTNPSPKAPEAKPGDCVAVTIADNGWHTNFYLPADAFPDNSPLRRDFPGAEWFVIGWGNEGFYRLGPDVSRGIDAIIPPSPTVLHVIGSIDPPEEVFLDKTKVALLSEKGLEVLIEEIEASFARDEAGEYIIVADGHFPGVSLFYRSPLSYHAFHTCNQWTAGRLRRAGANINASAAMLSGALMFQLKPAGTQCP